MTPTNTTPALDPSAIIPSGESNPTVDLLSEPTLEEITEEWNRYEADVKGGRLKGHNVPGGHYIAYYGGRIIDHDPDLIALQYRAAAKIGVHWARLVIRYCHPHLW